MNIVLLNGYMLVIWSYAREVGALFGTSSQVEREGFFLRFVTKVLRDNELRGYNSGFHVKKRATSIFTCSSLTAEREGFEPPEV